MRLERDRQRKRRQHHLFRFPAEYRERSAVLLLSRHDRWQTGFACGRHTVVHRRFPTRHLRTAVVPDFGCGREPLCSDILRHGRHTHPGMATRHRPLRSLRRSAPLAVVSLELTVPFYRFFRFLPRLTCGWSSRKIMSLPSISLCQPFSERRYGSTGGDCLMYS